MRPALLLLLLLLASAARAVDWFAPEAHEEHANIAFGEPGLRSAANLAHTAPFASAAPTCAPIDPPLLVTTHIPKCAGQSLRALFRAVQSLTHTFTTIHSQKFFGKVEGTKLKSPKSADVFEYWSAMARAGPRFHYEHHIRFIEGTGAVFLALVRDPAAQAVSHYYYKRRCRSAKCVKYRERFGAGPIDECVALPPEQWQETCNVASQSFQVSWLCGWHADCADPESPEALARAKQNIERNYVAVGNVERLAQFITVLEARLPGYFRGLTRTFENPDVAHSNKTPYQKPSAETMQRLRDARKNDYRLYEWVDARFSEVVGSC